MFTTKMNYQKEIENILNKNQFSRHFYVSFALACARDVESYDDTNKTKERNDVTQLWLNGKATLQQVREVFFSISYNTDAAHAASAAAYAAYAAISNAASAANAASNAASAAYSSNAKDMNESSKLYYEILIKMIEDLTDLEREFFIL